MQKNNELRKNDSQNMFDILKNFPRQVRTAIEIGKTSQLFGGEIKSNEYIVLGMGGSAIGGDLLKSYCYNTVGANNLSFTVNRTYDIPGKINDTTNVFACSYSGGTEETISGFEKSLKKTNRILCLTTGGELGTLADKNGIPKTLIPSGLQPRCAIGLLFFPLLQILMRQKAIGQDAINTTEAALNELLSLLDKKSELYADITNDDNPALNLAQKLQGTIPVIYSSSDRLDSVNLRWRCQIQENAKNLAFGNLLPEMNHNEINAWSNPESMISNFSLLFLIDKEDNERVKIRFNALEELLSSSVKQIITIESPAKYYLTRMFDLIYLGDWTSYYLALLNGIDPTPIPLISKLKSILAYK